MSGEQVISTEIAIKQNIISYLSSWSETMQDKIKQGDPRERLYEERIYFLEATIKELELRHPEIKWIPLSEKLPRKGEHVLACFDDEFITGVEYGEDGEWGLWQDSGEVVAWKPMPEPYVTDSNAKIKLVDIKSKALKDMPCSVCYGDVNVKELHINNTVHAVCEKCRETIVKQMGRGDRR